MAEIDHRTPARPPTQSRPPVVRTALEIVGGALACGAITALLAGSAALAVEFTVAGLSAHRDFQASAFPIVAALTGVTTAAALAVHWTRAAINDARWACPGRTARLR